MSSALSDTNGSSTINIARLASRQYNHISSRMYLWNLLCACFVTPLLLASLFQAVPTPTTTCQSGIEIVGLCLGQRRASS